MTSTIGSRLRYCRKVKGLSLSELARKSGLSKGAISMAETEKTMLNSDSLSRICQAMQVNSEFILLGREPSQDPGLASQTVASEELSLRLAVKQLQATQPFAEIFESLSRLSPGQLRLMMGFIEVVAASSENQPRMGDNDNGQKED